jgi:hypothetical protein
MPARHRIAVENDVVVSPAPDAGRAVLENESLSQQGRLFCVDHDKAVVLFACQRATAGRLNDGGNPRLLFRIAHERPPLYPVPSGRPVPCGKKAAWLEGGKSTNLDSMFEIKTGALVPAEIKFATI